MAPIFYFQFLIISGFVYLFYLITYIIYYSEFIQFKKDLKPEYDFIIVGSGTAGSLVAHRIATETNYTFMVIEAGVGSNFLLDIPLLGLMFHGSSYDWLYETVPQEHACHAMYGKKCQLTIGKVVGGSSKLNNMIHVRGNLSHYVDWFHGKYTKTFIEDQMEFIEKKFLIIDDIRFQSRLADAFTDAAKELGYKMLGADFDIGYKKSTVNQNNGKRWSTANLLDTDNILTNALVEKVIIKHHKAVGVRLHMAGEEIDLYAKKGVIISAGTYNSPKILQLSGIGPSNLLKDLNIPVVQDLPVGENLQDHLTTGLDLVMINESVSLKPLDLVNPVNILSYFIYGDGPYTTPGCEAISFMSSKNDSVPDLQFMMLPLGVISDRGSHLRYLIKLQEEYWYEYFEKAFIKDTATILPLGLHPHSKGHVHISSKNPYDSPSIDPKYLSDENDIKILISGLNILRKFLDTSSMKSIGAYMNPMPFYGCENYTMFSDDYWKCYVKHVSFTSYHPVGTCAMGLPTSHTSVIDTSFKVIGVENLYVVDGSVLPTMPSGNINAAIAMMANIFFEERFKGAIEKVSEELFCNKYDHIMERIYAKCIL